MNNNLYNGKYIQVVNCKSKLPNGKTHDYEVVKHPGAVAIIAIKDNHIILVKQNRPAIEKEIIEIPAGKLEPNEEPLDAALREFAEEAGYQAGKTVYLGHIYPSCGYTNEVIHLFLFDELIPCEMNLDPDEFLDVLHIELSEFEDMILNNDITDAKTLAAYFKYKLLK